MNPFISTLPDLPEVGWFPDSGCLSVNVVELNSLALSTLGNNAANGLLASLESSILKDKIRLMVDFIYNGTHVHAQGSIVNASDCQSV